MPKPENTWVTLRPLKDIREEAEQLGFELRWRDQEPLLPFHPRGTLFVRLIPKSLKARDAVARATGKPDYHIQGAVVYGPDDDYIDVVREAGTRALNGARSVMV